MLASLAQAAGSCPKRSRIRPGRAARPPCSNRVMRVPITSTATATTAPPAATATGAALAGFLSAIWGAPVAVAAGGAVVAVAVLVMGTRITQIEHGSAEQPVLV